jgi:nitroreductase
MPAPHEIPSMSNQTPTPHLDEDATAWAAHWIDARRTTLPKRLCGPGPDETAKAALRRAACAAPDHGQRRPWRFIEIGADRRALLGDWFAQALLERDPHANAAEQTQAREKAQRAPWLLLLVCRVRGDDPEVPASERLLSAGCAVQNLLLMATAMGLGSALTSGKAMGSRALREGVGLHADEDALCFVNVGHVREWRAAPTRPQPGDVFSVLGSA